MPAAFVRITWPDGQIGTYTLEQFYSESGPYTGSDMMEDIMFVLRADHTVTLLNEKQPGKKIRIDLINKGGLN